MSEMVLDASALLALLNVEPGSEVVEKAIPGAAISAVNLSEVVASTVKPNCPSWNGTQLGSWLRNANREDVQTTTNAKWPRLRASLETTMIG